MPVKIKLLFCLIFLYCLPATAQQIDWKVGFHGFADNREFANSKRPSQTIFAARLSPEVGLLIDSIHRIAGGFSYLQEFGSKSYNHSTRATLYYQYRDKGLEFNIGAFPRHTYIEDYPLAMFSDTINYYQPNIEGMLIRYQHKRFTQQIWIDWENRQTSIQREQFKVGISGILNVIPELYVKHYAVLWHKARAGLYTDNDQIKDNAVASAFIGTNLSHKVWFDSLTFQIGGIVNLDRLRQVYEWQMAKGLISEIYLEKHKIFAKNTYYQGQSLNVPYGDFFYRSKKYNRLDIGWIPLRHSNLEGRVSLSLHFSEGAIDNQQQFILRYTIGNKINKKSKTKEPPVYY